MGTRKRTIYIDSDLDKEFAKAAIDAEVPYSKMAEDVFRQYLGFPKETIGIEESTTKKKRGEKKA
jgi:hypothetical protein